MVDLYEGVIDLDPRWVLPSSLENDSLEDITGRTIAGRYKIEELLDFGGIGNIYRAFDLIMESEVAVKHRKSKTDKELAALIKLISEVREDQSTTAGEVMLPDDYLVFDKEMFEVYPLCSGETLGDLIATNALSKEQSYSIALQLVEQVRFVNNKDFIHHDVKPSNFLVNQDNGQIKIQITDWDSLVRKGEKSTFCSQYYLPASLSCCEFVDIYSLGVTIGELFFGLEFKTRQISTMTYDDLSLPHSAVFGCLLYSLESRLRYSPLEELLKAEKDVNFDFSEKRQGKVPRRVRRKGRVFSAPVLTRDYKIRGEFHSQDGEYVFTGESRRFNVKYENGKIRTINAVYFGEQVLFTFNDSFIESSKPLNPVVMGHMLKHALSYTQAFQKKLSKKQNKFLKIFK